MRVRLLRSGLAALSAALLSAACSLTTDLSGLAGGTMSSEGGTTALAEAGLPVDGSSSGALPDGGEAGAGTSAAYEAVVRADSPVAYYRFDDPADSVTAKDSVGTHAATATSAGVTFGGAGVRGGGATFDGTATLDLGDAFDFAGKLPFTLEVWVRSLTGLVGGRLIDKRDESVDPFKGYILYSSSGNPSFEGWGADLSAASAEVMGTTFSHVVLTVSYATGKGNATLYVNGKASPTGGFDNLRDLPDTPQHVVFGRLFSGVLDEIALYDKALPPDRILEHYRAGR